VENFPRIFNVEFTANMERELDLVEEGTDDWVKVLGDFYQPFSSTLASLKDREKEIKASMTEATDIKCDKCGGMMVIKWGRNGRFLGCENYPECRNTRPLPEEEEASKTDKKCDICGSPMVIKTGRFGRFLACSAYPECKNTKPLTLGIKCPRPGCDGEITERQTRGRRTFYGCTNYPKCNFASWDKPVNKQCPTCGNPYMVEKVTKASGEYLQCPECKSKIKEEDTEQTNPAEHSQK
jgi:DNA topoisomerase-1